MQTGRNFVQCEFKIVKAFGWKNWECAKGNGRYFIESWIWTSHVCNGGYKGQSCICGKYGELIHVDAGLLHWMAMKRIMKYLKGTLDFDLCLGGMEITYRGLYNADWTGDANDRRSHHRVRVCCCIGAILWKCKRQPTIALSMMET